MTEERSKAEIKNSALRRSDENQVLLPLPKNPTRKSWIFSFVPQGTTSFACNTRNIISSEARTSLPLEAQMNDVEALPQMKLLSAIPYFSMVSAIV